MAHTPGPYIATTDFASGVFWIETENELYLAEVFGGDHDGKFSGGVCEANANLFAAAPDLLEACKAALRHWYADESLGAGTSEDGEIARMLQQAIAQAEKRDGPHQ